MAIQPTLPCGLQILCCSFSNTTEVNGKARRPGSKQKQQKARSWPEGKRVQNIARLVSDWAVRTLDADRLSTVSIVHQCPLIVQPVSHRRPRMARRRLMPGGRGPVTDADPIKPNRDAYRVTPDNGGRSWTVVDWQPQSSYGHAAVHPSNTETPGEGRPRTFRHSPKALPSVLSDAYILTKAETERSSDRALLESTTTIEAFARPARSMGSCVLRHVSGPRQELTTSQASGISHDGSKLGQEFQPTSLMRKAESPSQGDPKHPGYQQQADDVRSGFYDVWSFHQVMCRALTTSHDRNYMYVRKAG
ncbi:hypothetical protein EGW08_021024 [Elysia chlorotica]|uniref:Uncharacterized protein n=1 Tax=Elysia chlorotica TaxID=188477 RepID=A0A3S1BNL8_ELYCH|nr:hypothetical protein EGW08_021024 [Elysia chlorotica]